MPADTLIVQQIEAGYPGQILSRLTLQGCCAPLRPVSWSGEQRRSINWVDGSGQADVRLAGPEERATTFRFKWLSRRMGETDALLSVVGTDNDEPVTSADDLEALINVMRREPSLVMITWRGRDVVGIIASVDSQAGYQGEWDVVVEFEPVQAPRYPQPALVQPRSPGSTVAQLIDTLDNAVTEVERAVTWSDEVLDQVNDRIYEVRSTLGRLERDAALIGNRTAQLNGVRQNVAAGFQQLFRTTAAVREAMPAVPNIAQTDDARMQLLAAAYLSDTDRQSRLVRHGAALARAQFRDEGDVLAVHEGTKGETIWSLSWRYYGTVAFADVISDRNGLLSEEILGGARIVIPKVPGHER